MKSSVPSASGQTPRKRLEDSLSFSTQPSLDSQRFSSPSSSIMRVVENRAVGSNITIDVDDDKGKDVDKSGKKRDFYLISFT